MQLGQRVSQPVNEEDETACLQIRRVSEIQNSFRGKRENESQLIKCKSTCREALKIVKEAGRVFRGGALESVQDNCKQDVVSVAF